MLRWVRSYWPTALWALAILYLSLASGSGLPKTHITIPNADKIVHLVMYMVLAALFTRDLRRDGRSFRWVICLAVLLPVAYGGLIELIQPFFPPRTCELLDWTSDSIGAIAGYLITDYVWTRTHSSIR